MKQSIWVNTFPVTSYLVDLNKRLSLQGLVSLIQEMAWAHANHLGHGYTSTRAGGGLWVIARQRIEMERWPAWEEEVTVRTWLRPPGTVLVSRDFEFLCGQEKVGQASAHWLTIHHKTRRPIRLPFSDDPTQFKQTDHLPIEPSKLVDPGELQQRAEFRVGPTDLDMNGHVNNTRFAQWVLDALPLEFYKTFQLRRYQVNFLAEAGPGERVSIWGPEPLGDPITLRGQRADGTVLFLASIEATELQ